MRTSTTRARRWGTALAVLAALVLVGAAPASAHEADPRIVTVLEEVEPALPEDVVVQVQAGIATQLVASNPTDRVLEVLGSGGRPFLRISSAGVFADVSSEEFLSTANPTGAVPRVERGAPRWVQVSSGHSWGWYDHRLHPGQLTAPADEQRPAELGDFAVPLRYGEDPVTLRGSVQFRPLLGAFLVDADPAPPGLTVQALPGRLPGLFLSVRDGRAVTVLGREGEPFLRITERGVEVNESSRTHVEDRQARGLEAGPPSPTPSFRLVAPGASSYTWLDARLRYPADLPPEEVLGAGGPTVVDRWEVPVDVDGERTALTGEVTWVPEPDAAARVAGAVEREEPSQVLLPALVGGAVVVLAGAALLARRARGCTSD